MTSHGHELGVDLGNLFNAGKYLIPGVADQLSDGASAIPSYIGNFYRSGGYGKSDGYNGPSTEVNNYVTELTGIMSTTAKNLNDVAVAITYIATHYQWTDEEARQEFNTRRKQLEGGVN